jgi:hypothetical protein
MGAANWTVIDVVSPFPLQLFAVAPVIVTADGPVTRKSEPFAATVLHRIGSANVMVRLVGAQGGAVSVPIEIGGGAIIFTVVLLPTTIGVPQLSSTVFPSEPVAIDIVCSPAESGADRDRVTESRSKLLEQPTPVAAVTVPPVTVKSLPLAATELHLIFLLKRTVIAVPSQFAEALATEGASGSVITAVPPVNTNPYPCCELLKLLTIKRYS